MTTITIDRKLLEEVVEIFDNASSTRYPHEILRDIRAALAAPATAPDEQIRKDAERYRWCVKNNLVLAGGTREFGWQIAPVGSEWNRYIDSAMKETP